MKGKLCSWWLCYMNGKELRKFFLLQRIWRRNVVMYTIETRFMFEKNHLCVCCSPVHVGSMFRANRICMHCRVEWFSFSLPFFFLFFRERERQRGERENPKQAPAQQGASYKARISPPWDHDQNQNKEMLNWLSQPGALGGFLYLKNVMVDKISHGPLSKRKPHPRGNKAEAVKVSVYFF